MMPAEAAGGGPPVPVVQVDKQVPFTHELPAMGHEQITLSPQAFVVEPHSIPAAAQAWASVCPQTQLPPPAQM